MIKKFLNLFGQALVLSLLMMPVAAYAQQTTVQGGTGTSSPSGILYGDGTLHLKTVGIGSGCTFVTGLLSCSGTPGGLNTQIQYNNGGVFGGISGATTNGTILSLTNALLGGATLTTSSVNGVTLTNGGSATTFLNGTGSYSTPIVPSFPFTPTSYGVSTSTTIGFLNGLFSTASSTFSGSFNLPGLSNGGLAVFGGLVSSGATTTAGTGLTYTGNAFNVNTTQNISALSNLGSGLVASNAGILYNSATSTNFVTSLVAGTGISLSAATGAVTVTATGGSGITWPWTSLTNYGTSTDATTTPLWIQSSIFGSTTSSLPALSILQSGSGPAALFGGGNVGIGTTSPGSIFSIGAVGNFTAATSTFYGTGGLSLASGCYAVNGVCLTAGAIGGGSTEAVNWATIAVLAGTPTYSNGTLGVGATLTEIGTGALSVDSNSPAAGDRVLVKNQASAFQNGIYTVTATGSGIASYILTRATDYNNATEITPGINTYVISGIANTDSTWAVSYTPPLTIGTTNLSYSESAAGGTVTSIATNNGITGGTITTTGTIGLATITANTVLGNKTSASAVPVALSTSTELYTPSNGISITSTLLGQKENRSFTYSTTTAWTGTTTIPLGVGYGEVWNNIKCYTDTGTLNVDFYHATTHFVTGNSFNASTTIGTIGVSGTDTTGDKVKVDIGTPATAPTAFSCTVNDTN